MNDKNKKRIAWTINGLVASLIIYLVSFIPFSFWTFLMTVAGYSFASILVIALGIGTIAIAVPGILYIAKWIKWSFRYTIVKSAEEDKFPPEWKFVEIWKGIYDWTGCAGRSTDENLMALGLSMFAISVICAFLGIFCNIFFIACGVCIVLGFAGMIAAIVTLHM